MSQIDEIKTNAEEIRKGLKQLGPNRVVALSVHKTKELVEELEERTDKLIAQLDSVN